LVFAVLHVSEVSSLRLYREEIAELGKPLFDFVLRRKECLIRESKAVFGIKI